MIRQFLLCAIFFVFKSSVAYSQVLTTDSLKINNTDKNGQKDGLLKYYYEDSTLQSEGIYINYNKSGIWKEYWSNGKLKYEINFIDGVPKGSYKTYDEKGRLKGDGKMEAGQIDGIFVSRDSIGIITSISYWEAGHLKEEKSLIDETKPTGTIELIDGKRYVWIAGKKIAVKE